MNGETRQGNNSGISGSLQILEPHAPLCEVDETDARYSEPQPRDSDIDQRPLALPRETKFAERSMLAFLPVDALGNNSSERSPSVYSDASNKRRKRDRPDGESPRFACPFHKYDPIRYSVNNTTEGKYRTCAGPGFPTVSRLK